jgi:uncharacterized membrane protein YkoI
MKIVKRLVTLALLGTLGLLPAAKAQAQSLPAKAAEAIRLYFPEARITRIGQERERGAWYYEVSLREGKRRFEVEVTEDGVIGEIEARVLLSDMPEGLQAQVRQRVGQGKIVRVEKHERRGVARSGKFVSLATPRISYEVKYTDVYGERQELQLSSTAILEVPDAVRQQIRQRFPTATISEVEVEDDDGVLLFVLSLRQDGKPFTAVVSREGDMVEYELALSLKELPLESRKRLSGSKSVKRAKSVTASVWETYATVEKGKLVTRRERTYLVILKRSGKVKEYRFDEKGALLSEGKWGTVDDEDDADDE